MADAVSGLVGLMGNWVGARHRVLRRAVDNAMGYRARRLGCACVPNVECYLWGKCDLGEI